MSTMSMHAPNTGKPPTIHKVGPEASALKAIFYSEPGVGKTTLLATAHDHALTKPLLFLDMEGGMASISHRTDIDYIRVQTVAELESVYWWLVKGKHEYKSLALDSLSEMQVRGLEQIRLDGKKKEKADGPKREDDELWQDDYGRSTKQMQRLARWFRDLPLHVFFSCLAREDDKEGRRQVMPALTPAASKSVMGYVDIVGYMFVQSYKEASAEDPAKTVDKTRRRLLLQPYGPYLAKDRLIRDMAVMDEPTIPKILDAWRAAHAKRLKQAAELTKQKIEKGGNPQ